MRALAEDGEAVVRVELANMRGTFVTLDEPDFDRIVDSGIAPRWVLNEAFPGFYYVRCYQPDVAGKLGLVARHVLEAGRGQVVKYRDGDRLNLRRSNLYLTTGRAKGQSPNIDEFSPKARNAVRAEAG